MFEVSWDTPLGQVFAAFCRRLAVQPLRVCFFTIDGWEVLSGDTAATLGLLDGGVIVAVENAVFL